MIHSPVSTPVPVASADALWREISEAAHESCLAKCTGRHRDARQLMEHTLPLVIREWSQVCGLPMAERKERLRKLFAQVQERVASAVISRRLAEEGLPPEERRNRALGRPMQLSRRIPIHDVAGMIDALNEMEQRWNPAAARPQPAVLTAPTRSQSLSNRALVTA
ncbi:hypothetical protein [Actomonas aquatica]|uniref:Uncharacterized protein n=1 Tax=Actomonas aquatica TaxID=2866162 RepID=A0ABZ1C7Z4_9BACT|nr:hypothetical protein [Opitutus sp. WL0086]WRQ87542.1 hypothetical protein K1X11_022225 [Opitutus sp. WL0086]